MLIRSTDEYFEKLTREPIILFPSLLLSRKRYLMLGKTIDVNFKSFSAPELASLLLEKFIFFVSVLGRN